MRVTSVTLAFIFFSTVLATPIYLTRGDTTASLAKRNKHTSSAGSTQKTPSTARRSSGQVSASGPRSGKTAKTAKTKTNSPKHQQCKRVTPSELVKALRSVDGPEIGAGKFGKTYRLTQKFENQAAVVKVVKTKEQGEETIKQEVTNLKHVKQFLAWGHKEAADGIDAMDFIVMPDMGMSYKEAKLSPTEANELMTKASENYKTEFGMTHDDLHLANALFKKVGETYVCHLVDWLWAINGQTHFEDPGHPIPIGADDCVFNPWAVSSDSEHSSGSEGYVADGSGTSEGSHHSS
ncbi:hypothetical protein F5887DRAFT_56745 [Amanita rubescens]|nr:hypothetical protein F5887DRAFT_56745 [Amanita rubescens]